MYSLGREGRSQALMVVDLAVKYDCPSPVGGGHGLGRPSVEIYDCKTSMREADSTVR